MGILHLFKCFFLSLLIACIVSCFEKSVLKGDRLQKVFDNHHNCFCNKLFANTLQGKNFLKTKHLRGRCTWKRAQFACGGRVASFSLKPGSFNFQFCSLYFKRNTTTRNEIQLALYSPRQTRTITDYRCILVVQFLPI